MYDIVLLIKCMIQFYLSNVWYSSTYQMFYPLFQDEDKLVVWGDGACNCNQKMWAKQQYSYAPTFAGLLNCIELLLLWETNQHIWKMTI